MLWNEKTQELVDSMGVNERGVWAMFMLEKIAKDWDTEGAHVEADRVLVMLLRAHGYGDVADAFERLPKWYA